MGLLDDGGLLDLGVDDRLPVRGRGEVLPAQDGHRVLANLRQLRLALPVSRVRRKAVGNFDQLYGNGKAAPAGGCCLTLLPLASSSSTLAATTDAAEPDAATAPKARNTMRQAQAFS